MRRWSIVIAFGVAVAVMVSGCSVIDDDLSDCGEELELDYDLHLVTNMSIELQNELDRKADANLLKALRDYLAPVFTDYAHDLDLSFYDTQGDSAQLHHERHIMDANELSYKLYLPRRYYMHTAVANVEDNKSVSYEGTERCHQASFRQAATDTVVTHKTGLFTARQPMQLSGGASKTFFIHLYMANCAAALVLDTSAASFSGIKVVSTGFASHFNIADSTYVYAANPPIVKTDRIETGSDGQLCFCTVNFPSQELSAVATRNIIETEAPFVSLDGDRALWQFRVYVTLPDGKVTESILGVRKPLRAGQLKIIRARVYANGGLEPDDQNVGVSVTLDWNEAGHHHVPL